MPTKPGSGGAGAPGNFVYANADRMVNDPQITRMPSNQAEWNGFVQQLNKIIHNESDGFTPTFTGFSADPSSPFVWWQRYGQIVLLEFHFNTGTSNATTFSIDNLPTIITPYTTQLCQVYGMEDSGGSTDASAAVNSDGTIDFYPSFNPNDLSAWTGSGNKGFTAGTTLHEQSIMYFLRNPNKL